MSMYTRAGALMEMLGGVSDFSSKERIALSGRLNETKPDGWIAFFNGKRLEITADQADSLYGAKQFAINALKVPKSKQSLLAIEPAYNESADVQGAQDVELAHLDERLVDIKKINRDELDSGLANSLDAMQDAGFKAKYDVAKGEGTFYYGGVEGTFSAGGENLYFTLPQIYFKSAPKEGVEAVKKMLDVVYDFGGYLSESATDQLDELDGTLRSNEALDSDQAEKAMAEWMEQMQSDLRDALKEMERGTIGRATTQVVGMAVRAEYEDWYRTLFK